MSQSGQNITNNGQLCPLCKAVKVDNTFVCQRGNLSPVEMNSRVCHLGKAHGKQGCINDCNSVIISETFEGKRNRSEAMLQLETFKLELTLGVHSDD